MSATTAPAPVETRPVGNEGWCHRWCASCTRRACDGTPRDTDVPAHWAETMDEFWAVVCSTCHKPRCVACNEYVSTHDECGRCES